MLLNSINVNDLVPIILLVISVVLFLLILYISIGMLNLKKYFRYKRMTEEEIIIYDEQEKGFKREWLDIPYDEMWEDSDFGYKIFARLYMNEKKTNKYIIALHGYTSAGITMLTYMNEFRALGYNVVIPDNRYCGKSGGEYASFGYFEKFDLLKWIKRIREIDENAEIGLFGVSLGAATVLMASEYDEKIKYVIAYCGYANFKNILLTFIKNSKLLYNLIIPSLNMGASIMFGIKLKDIRADLALKNTKMPTLLLHSKEDAVVVYKNAEILKSCRDDVKLVTFEKGQHARSIIVNHDVFMAEVKEFLEKNG
ncbi:MAG: alpha/beta fold hydrolase [Endomicrobium sp.]|jgi:alpha-beta hydrolase superfamily lysophospholipase|nr:alpha/beta fold hydrolase [Endomicrobium sp.]